MCTLALRGLVKKKGLTVLTWAGEGKKEVVLWGVQEDLLKNLATSKSVFRMKETVSFLVLAPQCPSSQLE